MHKGYNCYAPSRLFCETAAFFFFLSSILMSRILCLSTLILLEPVYPDQEKF